MGKFGYEWFLFGYKDGVPDVISKSYKTKAAAKKRGENTRRKRAAASV
jgi:hypothetical protein